MDIFCSTPHRILQNMMAAAREIGTPEYDWFACSYVAHSGKRNIHFHNRKVSRMFH